MANPALTNQVATAGDGVVGGGSNTSWATARGLSTGDTQNSANTSTYLLGYGSFNAGDAFTSYLFRGFLAFDLSSIPAGSVVQSATIDLYVTTKYSLGGGTTANNSACLVAGTQASTSSLATSDFNKVGSTELASRLSYSGMTTSAYNTFTLNTAGLTHLTSAVGSTAKLAVRTGYDLDSVAPTNTNYSGALANTVDNASNKPRITVTYSTVRTTSDSWAWSDRTAHAKTTSGLSRVQDDAWAWTDTAAPYRRAVAEVQVWDAAFNTTLSGAHNPVGATITVTSTTGAASSGTIWVYDPADYSQARATYTSMDATHFYGCSWTSVLGDLNFPTGCGVSASDAETHFPQIVAIDDPATTSTPELVVTAKQGAGHGMLNGVLVMKRSTNGGITWGSQSTIQTAVGAGLSPPRGCFGHTLARLKNGRLLVMWYEHDLGYALTPGSTGPVYNYMSYSDDRGVTWSTPVLMNLNFGFSNRDGYTGFSSIVYTGSGSNSTYGDVYIPVTGNVDGITVHTSGETYRWETWLYKITDGGASGSVTKVAEVFKYATTGRAIGEAGLAFAENGDWIMHGRKEPTTGSPDSGDSTKRDRWQSRSTDLGVTWGTAAKVIDSLANGAVLTKLPGGTLISTGSPVAAGDGAAYGQTASVLSHDNGTTWTRALKTEATDATYSIYNGSDTEVVVNNAATLVNTAFTYSQENSTQTGARTMFRWYVDPVKRAADTWAWTDSVARTLTLVPQARTTTDTWTWSDTNTRTPSKARTTSDTWTWTDTAVKGQGQGRNTFLDTWTWTDSAMRTVSLIGTTYTRTTTDTWTWVDSVGSPTTYKRIATPTSLSSTQASNSTLSSDQFSNSVLIPADSHPLSI